MKRILTLVLCWLIAFTAMAKTTFKAKTALSAAGGYITSLNKVDGSFEDVVSQWVASVGTIVPTASTEFQGNYKGVWSGTGAGTLDLQWTATASNTYEASAQVNVKGKNDVYVCAYVGPTETGCKLIPALNKIQKVSVVADSVLSSAFNLRLKHTGSDAFSIDVDDGKIEPWTPQAVNLTQQEAATYTGYTSKDGSNRVRFANRTLYRAGTIFEDNWSTVATDGYVKVTAKKNINAVLSANGVSQSATYLGISVRIYNSSGTLINIGAEDTTTLAGYAGSPSVTMQMSAGDYALVMFSNNTGANDISTNFSITATAISDNVVQSWQPSDSLGELRFLPQNVAPKGFISAFGSSIGKTAGTYQGDAYYDLYKVLWTQSSVTAGEPYVISSAKGADAATDWAANKTITIDVSGLVVRAYKSGTTAAVGAKQLDAFQDHKHDTLQSGIGTYGGSFLTQRGVWGTSSNVLGDLTGAASYASGANGTPRISSETRMTNIAQYAFIRYGNDAPTLYALPTRSEVFSANISASGVATNATQNFVTSCTNAAPSVCSLWSSFGVAPICWTHTTDITKRAEVSSSTATTTTVARTDTGTAFNLFCHLK